MKLKSPYLVKPHSSIKLSRLSTSSTPAYKSEKEAEAEFEKHCGELDKLQEVLYASQKKSILIVLQGMDTAGKDGTIRHIFSGVNPRGCDVASLQGPTPVEAKHDFLWRCHAQVPERGMIGIFNRSHYEDVLSPYVHGLTSAKVAHCRMDDINEWGRTLTDQDVVIFKFFLHISHAEQTRRLQARIDTPEKRWKLSPADFEERRFWDKYAAAYEDILHRTSRKHAPWFVIPADHKWFRNVAISQILVDAMQGLKLRYPAPTFEPKGLELAEETVASAAKKAKASAKPGGKAESIAGGRG